VSSAKCQQRARCCTSKAAYIGRQVTPAPVEPEIDFNFTAASATVLLDDFPKLDEMNIEPTLTTLWSAALAALSNGDGQGGGSAHPPE
jgi:hypothetical protein